jgi:hypothetical protein
MFFFYWTTPLQNEAYSPYLKNNSRWFLSGNDWYWVIRHILKLLSIISVPISQNGQCGNNETITMFSTKYLLTHSKHLSSPPVFSGGRIPQSLVFCVVFFYIVVSTFPFGHCRRKSLKIPKG